MKTIIILFLVFFIGINTNAQETIEITYESFFVSEGSSLYKLKIPTSKRNLNWHSIISNDTSFTFAGVDKNSKTRRLKNGNYPDKPLHHSTYYLSENNSIFATSAFKGNYFICSVEKPNLKNYWMDTTKIILGYECQAAMIYREDGDSSTMWISRNLKPGLITYHHGYVVPGIAMETLDLKNALYYKAVKLEKTNNHIYFPKDYPQLTLEEFRNKKR